MTDLNKSLVALYVGWSISGSLWAADPLALANPAGYGSERAAYAEGHVFAANDLVPIREVSKRWEHYQPKAGKNLAIISGRIESGMQLEGYRLGYVQRHEWLAEAHRDTADVAYADKSNASYDNGRSYVLGYRLRGFSASGLRLAKSFSLEQKPDGWTVDWGVAASVLQGSKVRREDIDGSALATGGRSYTASLDWRQDYSGMDTVAQGFAPAFRDGSPRGVGYSTDFGVRIGRKDGWRMEWALTDFVGAMRWTSIPEKTLAGTNVFAGTLPGGRMVRTDFVENLPAKQSLLLSIPLKLAHMEFADSIVRGYHFPSAGIRYETSGGWGYRIDYDFRFRSAGLGVTHQSFFASVCSDSMRVSEAKAFGISIGARFSF